MAQFPTTPEELNEQIAQFKRQFSSVDEEKRFYQSVLKRYDAKHSLNGNDIYMFDIPLMASLPQPNKWLKFVDLICQNYDNYLDLYPRLKTYILDHASNLDDLFKSYKLFDNDAKYATIVANKINSYVTCIRYAEFNHIGAEIRQIFENRAIVIMQQNPNERYYVPIKLRNLSIAALSTHAYDPQPIQIQEQKPTLPSVHLELQNIAKSNTRDAELIKEQLNNVCTHLAEASDRSDEIIKVLTEIADLIKKLTKK
jgi:hypothetical protein